MNRRILFFITTGLSLLWSVTLTVAAEIDLYDLSVNHHVNPIGLDSETPTFSWKIKGDQRNLHQTAYRLTVSESASSRNPKTIWESGKMESDQSIAIRYKGAPLESRKRYDWQVTIWTNQGAASASSNGTFEMGLLAEEDWSARWIGASGDGESLNPSPAPLFRKSFTIEKPIERARAYVSGLGYFNFSLNGDPASDHVLDPVVTRYDRRTKYVVFDISSQLRLGENVLGITLGNGWLNQHTKSAWDFDRAPWRAKPRLIAQIELLYSDGSQATIVSDESWKWTEGPITFDGIRNGIHYDASREVPDWDSPGLDDSNWKNVSNVKAPTNKLSAQLMPPARVIEQLDVEQVYEINETIKVYDFGRNTSGRIKAAVSGQPGDEVIFRYGERIHPDGRLDQEELSRFIRTGETQTDRYKIGPTGHGVFEPSFMYHGFQYVEVETSSADTEVKEIHANVIHTDLQRAGGFECSDSLLNALFQTSVNSYLTNFHSYPTDCPHREKIGWTGDGQVVMDFGLFNFDSIHAYEKWLDDMADEQQPSGQVPSIIPTSGWGYNDHDNQTEDQIFGGRDHGPQWAGVCVSLPWILYQYTGDKSILDKYYTMMTRYFQFLEGQSEDGILHGGIDDHKWIRIRTEGTFISTAYFYHLASILEQSASALGLTEDARRFRKSGEIVKDAFNRKFLDTDTGQYDVGSQTSQALALAFDLVPEANHAQVVSKLVETIEVQDGHPVAGVVGVRALTDVLPAINRSDLFFEMVTLRTMPSWGWWLDQGATTLWQNWDGTQSRNHVMFGSFNDFFYENLAGIQIDPDHPGFKHFFVKPYIPDRLEHASAWHESPFGTVRSAWKKKGSELLVSVEVPSNTRATVELPLSEGYVVTESEETTAKSRDEYSVVIENGYAFISIGSGTYNFVLAPLQ